MTKTTGAKAGQQQIMEAKVTPREHFYDASEEAEDLGGDLLDQPGGAVYREDVTLPQQEGTAMGRMVGRTGVDAAEGEAAVGGEAEGMSAGEAIAGAEVGEEVGGLATAEAVSAGLDSTGVLAPIGILVGVTAALGSLFGGLFGHHHTHRTIPKPPNFSIPSLQTGV